MLCCWMKQTCFNTIRFLTHSTRARQSEGQCLVLRQRRFTGLHVLDWTTPNCMWSVSSEDCLGNYSGGRSVSISETSTKTALGKTSVFVKHTILSEFVRSWTEIQFRTLLLPSGLFLYGC